MASHRCLRLVRGLGLVLGVTTAVCQDDEREPAGDRRRCCAGAAADRPSAGTAGRAGGRVSPSAVESSLGRARASASARSIAAWETGACSSRPEPGGSGRGERRRDRRQSRGAGRRRERGASSSATSVHGRFDGRPSRASAGQRPAKVRKQRQRFGKAGPAGSCVRQDGAMRVLIVEDEEAIAEPLAEGLRREGFESSRRRPARRRWPRRRPTSSCSTFAFRTSTASTSAGSCAHAPTFRSSSSPQGARRPTVSSGSSSAPTITSSSRSGCAS